VIDVGRRQQGFHLRFAQRMHKALRLLGRGQFQAGINLDAPLPQQHLVEALDDRQAAVGRGGLALLMAGRDIAFDIVRLHRQQAINLLALLFQPLANRRISRR
jgi:hypothetical protein